MRELTKKEKEIITAYITTPFPCSKCSINGICSECDEHFKYDALYKQLKWLDSELVEYAQKLDQLFNLWKRKEEAEKTYHDVLDIIPSDVINELRDLANQIGREVEL